MSISGKMKLVRASEREQGPATGDLYVGDISFAPLAGGQVEVYSVAFAAGARNRVHVHKHDQVLIATEGRGIIADAAGEHLMEPGDVVTIPAGHPHWHGATEESDFVHLTVAVTGDEIENIEADWGALQEGTP